MLQKIILLALLCILFHLTGKFCEKKTDGFSVAFIHSDLKHNPAWDSPLPSEEARAVLTQRFRYLGCGGQSFVFASEDGNYVLKFFKHRKFRKPYSYLLHLPLPGIFDFYRINHLHKALFKLKRDFTSYRIAYDDLREETGIIYQHLNKTKGLFQPVQIVDKIDIAHEIDLDKVEFLVQRRAKLLFPHIDQLMSQGDIESAKHTLHAVVEALVCRCKKGVFDEDPRLPSNLGILGQRAMFIDIGRFVRDPTRTQRNVYASDVKTITSKRLRPWLEQSHPELVSALDEEIQQLLN
jgi:hypothetical protein